MKFLIGLFVAIAAAIPAFAVPPTAVPRPAPAPDLAVGVPAVLAVIGAYAIARLLVRRRATRGVRLS
jgi:hypothetical protein